MKKFIIFVCFFLAIGTAFALPLTLSSSDKPSISNVSSPNKIDYSGEIQHLFTHCLLAYPSIALSPENNMSQYYDQDCITPHEFESILQQLYDNNYALIDINSIFTQQNGEIIKTKLQIPEGKKPLIFSFDDVNYDTKKMKTGMVDKIIVDENGKLATQTTITWSTIPSIDINYNNEFITILENFVEKHPDFSIDGAKGTICLTGYDGILGYRTSTRNTTNREQEINSAKIVVDKLLEKGWNFACHSFGHYHMTKISDEKFAEEIKLWQDQVESIIGKTKIYIYPYGDWELVDENGENIPKHQMLIDAGFQLFCGVGTKSFFSYLPFSSSTNKTLFMDRTPIDGYSIQTKKQALSHLFDTISIYDYQYRQNDTLV